ncbi:hypothetical protein LZ554_009271 [Drepanopeziza brunnea f. sp. 'monogermtubi']|nr:hypothetical protein LZ554_009271 [Drepanopeziza brunnea f. sp. 'monogermtubi']
MMKIVAPVLLLLLAGFAAAGPTPFPTRACPPIETVENEYTLGGCKPIIFFYARGSSEAYNMGNFTFSPGPPTAQGLEDEFGCENVAVEGIGYAALLETNFIPGGADPAEVKMMHDLFLDAAAKCPYSILLGGGYSQGAALCHRAIENLPEEVKDRIAGVAMYGDTQNTPDKGSIPNFPPEKTLIICNDQDVICKGNLTITRPHGLYVQRVPEALAFFKEKVTAARY